MRSLALITLGLVTNAVGAAEYDLYFLGGQSNMDGYGHNAELPDTLQGQVDGAWIFTGNPVGDDEPAGGLGLWAPLEPGHGVTFSSDGKANTLGERFGAEITFATRLRTDDGARPVAIIKYSRGGSSLARDVSGDYGDWDPDYPAENQYDFALRTIAGAMSERDIDGDGKDDVLIPRGIVWMQGESDAYEDIDAALAYEANLKRLMELLRAALRSDDLPVAIGKITDSGRDDDGQVMDNIDVVQAAQQRFVDGDHCAAYVTAMDEFDYPPDDAWHYTSPSYLLMGTAFAEAMIDLHARCGE